MSGQPRTETLSGQREDTTSPPYPAPLYGRFLRGLAVAGHRPAWRVRGHETTFRQAHEQALILAGTALTAIDDAAGAIGIFASKNSAAYLGILAAL